MEEKKQIKISLGVAVTIGIVIISLITTVGILVYLNYIRNDENKINTAKEDFNIQKSDSKKENDTQDIETIDNKEDESQNVKKTYEAEELYKKYRGLNWLFREDKPTKIDFLDKTMEIENGTIYLTENGSKKKVETFKGKAKYIAGWGRQTLERVYVLTEDGKIWESDSGNDEKGDLKDNFVEIKMKGTVIDITNGDEYTRITEPPYFLLSTGELINKEGSLYEELDGEFIKSFGTMYGNIFVKANKTIYEYNYEQRKYKQIKDENGKAVKLKDAFIQMGSYRNNLIDEIKGNNDGYCNERVFIITEDNTLLYFDGYENVTAKEYSEAKGKTIELHGERQVPTQEGGHTLDMEIRFSDDSKVRIIDVLIPDFHR